MEDACCEVAGSGADFEDYVGLFEGGLRHYSVGYAWVLQDVLAMGYSAKEPNARRHKSVPKICVHLENVVCGFCLGRSGDVGRAIGAVALLRCCFRHLQQLERNGRVER